MDLSSLTITSFHKGLLEKQFSALEVAQAYLSQIKKSDHEIGAYLSTNESQALKTAEEADIAVAKDKPVGALSGVPMAIKDNILIEGLPATAGSKILENYVASYDAGVIKELKKQGCVFLGKTNMDEFAMGASTENSGFKPSKNPHNLKRVPGGSSGGSAAAVAANMALGALGSDTGGSIRQPASFCGVVGLNPTYGTVSRSGLIAMASSLDQIGPLTKTVDDATILFRALAKHDPMDSTNANHNYEKDNFDLSLEKIKKLVIGIPDEYFGEGVEEEVSKRVDGAREVIESLGLKTKRVSLPHTKYGIPCYYIIVPAEVSANLARFDGIRYGRTANSEHQTPNVKEVYFETRGGGFGEEVKRRIMLGTFVLSAGYHDAYYKKAQEVRTLIKQDFDSVFQKVDVLLTPTAPTRAFPLGEKSEDPVQMYLADAFTAPVKLAGIPAISIPTKNRKPNTKNSLLPVGFQLIGKYFREADILGIGRYYERATSTKNI